jgi:phosphopantetheinyl transferase (holo-ACP synthase)
MTEGFSFAFCPVSPPLQALSCITVSERKLLSEKATPKRIGDFIAGRVAAKLAIRSHLSLPDSLPLSILRTEHGNEAGKPCAVIDDAGTILPEIHLSITHADKKAYAAASHTRIGIDNVTIETYNDAFVQDVFQPEELQAWAAWLRSDCNHPLAVCTGFAAKEAFLKWLGIGLRGTLPMTQIIPLSQTVSQSLFFQKQFHAACYVHHETGDAPELRILDGYFSIQDGQVIVLLTGE